MLAGATPVLVHNCGETFEEFADKAEIARADYAAEYTSPTGKVYRAHNAEQLEVPDEMNKVFKDPKNDHHGGCAETKCLIKAYNAEGMAATRGGKMDVVHVSDDLDGQWEHFDRARPCGRCARLQGNLGIG
ncbi:hypothetical protein ACIPLC_33245 [Kitasatospora sp. NPDC086801]|uniref:hypothetical protein n=1 Tax=Kitasatospora sp. NPDC086801 TaxID=3364066 RepID=UPI003816E540